MPITVAHQPSAYGIGAIAFEAGKGQWRQQQQENALRQAALYLQGLQQQQGYQLAQQRNALDWAQLQSQNQRFDAGLMQNAWNSQNELAAQNQWRQDQLNQQRNLWDAQKEREQLEWDQRRQMHQEDMTARGEIAAANREFQKSEFDRQQEVELNAVGQKIKAKYEATRAIIERDVKDPALKQQFLDALAADMTGVKFSDMAKPPQKTSQQLIDEATGVIDGVRVQVRQRAGGTDIVPIKGIPNHVELHKMALDEFKAQMEMANKWKEDNRANYDSMQQGLAAVDTLQQEQVLAWKMNAERMGYEHQAVEPQSIDQIKAKLRREFSGEGEAPPQQQGQPQQPQLEPKQQEQVRRLEVAEQSAPPLVQDAARKLKAAAMSGSPVTPELEQAAMMVKSWLSSQQ